MISLWAMLREGRHHDREPVERRRGGRVFGRVGRAWIAGVYVAPPGARQEPGVAWRRQHVGEGAGAEPVRRGGGDPLRQGERVGPGDARGRGVFARTSGSGRAPGHAAAALGSPDGQRVADGHDAGFGAHTVGRGHPPCRSSLQVRGSHPRRCRADGDQHSRGRGAGAGDLWKVGRHPSLRHGRVRPRPSVRRAVPCRGRAGDDRHGAAEPWHLLVRGDGQRVLRPDDSPRGARGGVSEGPRRVGARSIPGRGWRGAGPDDHGPAAPRGVESGGLPHGALGPPQCPQPRLCPLTRRGGRLSAGAGHAGSRHPHQASPPAWAGTWRATPAPTESTSQCTPVRRRRCSIPRRG